MEKQKQKFYKAKWFLWVCLIFFPPIGLILLWTCHKQMKNVKRIILSVVSALWFVILIASRNGARDGFKDGLQDGLQESTTHLYDYAQVKDLMNGVRTAKIGEYSIIEVKSEDVTEEALTDWYYNYVIENDYNWCMILYTDKNDTTGVYAIKGIVQKDVRFTADKHGDYALSEAGATANAITYVPAGDGKLKEIKAIESSEPSIGEAVVPEISESEISAIKAMIEGLAEENFKEDGHHYEVLYDERAGFMLNFWYDGIAMEVALIKANNDETSMVEWNYAKEAAVLASKAIQEAASKLTDAYVIVTVNLSNDLDTSKTLLSVINGLVFYDVMDE